MNDNVWINLKVLSQLPAFAKLNTFHELFYIEKPTFYNPIGLWRMLRGDNRQLTIKRIDGLIEKAELVIKSFQNTAIENNLKDHLKESIKGINNLKKTYEEDPTTIAALERLLDKINQLTTNDLSEFKTPIQSRNSRHDSKKNPRKL